MCNDLGYGKNLRQIKHKTSVSEKYSSGTIQDTHRWWANIEKGPLMFANSDELRKMQNRNRKNKRKR